VQSRAGQCRAGEDRTGQDRKGKAGENRTGQDRTGKGKAGEYRTGQNHEWEILQQFIKNCGQNTGRKDQIWKHVEERIILR
jgi:hypothetical protein